MHESLMNGNANEFKAHFAIEGQRTHLELVIAEDKDLKVLQTIDVVGQTSQLVGAQVELYHLNPATRVCETVTNQATSV